MENPQTSQKIREKLGDRFWRLNSLYYIKDKPQYRVVARIPTGEKYSLMHAKGWASATQVNYIITTMKKEGVIADLHKKWFGADADPESSTVKVVDVLK